MTLRIDIRDARLRGGRLNISAGTDRETTRRKRETVIRMLLQDGHIGIVEAMRARRLHITEVESAFRAGTLASLNGSHTSETLAVAAKRYLRTVRGTRSVRTHELYRSIVAGLLEHFGRTTPLDKVTVEMAEAYLHADRKRGRLSERKPWSALHQRQTRNIAGRIWAGAGVTPNPWKLAGVPRVRRDERPYLTAEEWRHLATSLRGQPMHALLALGVLGGLRLGEIRHLRTDIDVDLEARQLIVQGRKGEHTWQPKTDNSKRKVPICDELFDVLVAHRRTFAGDRFFIRIHGLDQPMHSATVRKWTIKAFGDAGIRYGLDDGLTLHCTRHTFATWMLLGRPPEIPPVPIHVVAALMGDTVEVVLRTYAHLLRPNLEAGVATLDSLLRSPDA